MMLLSMPHRKKGFNTSNPKNNQKSKTKKHAANTAERLVGRISINSKGVGFVTLGDEAKLKTKKRGANDDDIQIPNEYLNTALHGDTVEIRVVGKNRFNRKEGAVEKILKRVKTNFVGVLEKNGQNFFLVPDDKKVYRDIFIPQRDSIDAEAGEKVYVQMKPWIDAKRDPQGIVLKRLGRKGDNSVEMHSIVLEKGFEIDFPAPVTAEAHALEKSEKPISAEEIKKRLDIRDTLTMTIDPFDAKDFDDAISYKELPNNELEIGVHIADVSHYVRPGTDLDREARKRAFSVYLVDRTIPMLPEVLSNDLCSLNPHEDKLAFSAIFVIQKPEASAQKVVIKSRWFGRTVINSDKRFSYEEAQEVLNTGKGPHLKELDELNRIAKIFQKEKYKNGAIDFETEEVKFRLDETGRPIEVYKKSRLDTHKLVEEYMLLANREVAEFMFKAAAQKRGAAAIYRIHDLPQNEKITELSIFLKALGYELPIKNGTATSKDIQALLKKIEGSAEESLIKTATIRSMSKAIYDTKNIGHFGLSYEFYTHFTSPIRRYPDLIVHRTLANHLSGSPISKDEFSLYQKISEESSEQEIRAAEAERTSIKLKQVEYMSERIGQTFEGTISGVTEWGIYIEEANTKCEGMSKLRDMTDDYYNLNQKTYSVVGEKTKKKFALGDKVKFKVVAADIERKSLDYLLVD